MLDNNRFNIEGTVFGNILCHTAFISINILLRIDNNVATKSPLFFASIISKFTNLCTII